MAIVTVYRIPDESADEDQKSYKETWNYIVRVDSISDSASTVKDATDGVTTIPATNTLQSSLRVTGKTVRRDQDNPLIWKVSVNLSANAEDESSGGSGNGGGEKWNIDVSSDGIEYEEVIYQDRNGVGITNAAGQYFDPPITKVYYDEEIVVSFDTDEIDIAAINACRGKLNDAAVTMNVRGYTRTFAAETMKLVKARWQTDVADAQDVFHTEYVFHIREDGNKWKKVVLNQGAMCLDADGNLIPCRDTNGLETIEQCLLEDDGTQAIPPRDAEEEDFLKFDVDKTADYQTLFTGLT